MPLEESKSSFLISWTRALIPVLKAFVLDALDDGDKALLSGKVESRPATLVLDVQQLVATPLLLH